MKERPQGGEVRAPSSPKPPPPQPMTHFARLEPSLYALEPALAARVLTPALAVHLDIVRSNVRRVIALLDGAVERWRPHVKTTKLPAVWRILAEEGVRHFKCATTRELDVLLDTLAGAGVTGADVLVAYPHRPPALGRLAEIAERHGGARVSVLLEDAELAPQVPDVLGHFVDVNPGMDRTGIPARDEARIRAVARSAGARLRGLHWYDGHLHDADVVARRAAVERGLGRAAALVAALRDEEGLECGELCTAGTPAFLSSLGTEALADRTGTLHRVSPGTVVFHDLRSEIENDGLGLEPAAVVLARVVSHPDDGLVTCDAGSKSIAAEAGAPVCEVVGAPGLVAQHPSEEHLPLRVTAGAPPPRGTLLALVPMHVCPTVNLAEEALLLDGGRFVEVASVRARAHELLLP